jgi:hypothetical protein
MKARIAIHSRTNAYARPICLEIVATGIANDVTRHMTATDGFHGSAFAWSEPSDAMATLNDRTGCQGTCD